MTADKDAPITRGECERVHETLDETLKGFRQDMKEGFDRLAAAHNGAGFLASLFNPANLKSIIFIISIVLALAGSYVTACDQRATIAQKTAAIEAAGEKLNGIMNRIEAQGAIAKTDRDIVAEKAAVPCPVPVPAKTANK